MFELFVVIIFLFLLLKTIGLVFRLTWGVAKIVASILIGLALPVLVLCVLFAGGIVLLVPVAMIALAAGIVKACL